MTDPDLKLRRRSALNQFAAARAYSDPPAGGYAQNTVHMLSHGVCECQGRGDAGIATAGVESAQGFNFFVPINTAWEVVRREGVTPDAGLFTPVLAKGARSL